MMRYRLTPAARADLDAIWAYTLQNWGMHQAERYIRALSDACAAAADGRGQAADAIRPGYRRLLSGAHVLFFRLAADGGADIIRILHQRMDVERHLGPESEAEAARRLIGLGGSNPTLLPTRRRRDGPAERSRRSPPRGFTLEWQTAGLLSENLTHL
jgi:toxin ParE1/3/4